MTEPLTDDLIARLKEWLRLDALGQSVGGPPSCRELLRAAAEALAAASRPPQEPRLTEQDTIDMVVTHWFTQGGEAQFGAIPTCHNADEVVSEILRAVRVSASPAAPPPWQPIETAPRDGTWFWVKRDNPPPSSHFSESIFKWDDWYGGWFGGTGWYGKDQLGTMRFTHWRMLIDQPLPSPPASEDKS